ncbi:uncharacterized protein PG986_013292 [Apiospora aurea]|uniref:Uncharacterized protein n=1 Tax=Apiospora aurea TaxID=335848 RepID=A0ABR1PV71_9PEZI
MRPTQAGESPAAQLPSCPAAQLPSTAVASSKMRGKKHATAMYAWLYFSYTIPEGVFTAIMKPWKLLALDLGPTRTSGRQGRLDLVVDRPPSHLPALVSVKATRPGPSSCLWSSSLVPMLSPRELFWGLD